jgi:hypothetical protein
MDLRTQKFNGKVYGKAGAYSIYVNNTKIDVSDSDVLEYNNYLKEIEEVKEKMNGVLSSIEVQDINVLIGGEKRFMELTLEQMKAKLKNFPVETIWSGIVEGHDGLITKATYKGEFVRGLLQWEKDGKVIDSQFLNEKDIENALSEFKNDI